MRQTISVFKDNLECIEFHVRSNCEILAMLQVGYIPMPGFRDKKNQNEPIRTD